MRKNLTDIMDNYSEVPLSDKQIENVIGTLEGFVLKEMQPLLNVHLGEVNQQSLDEFILEAIIKGIYFILFSRRSLMLSEL